MRTSSTLASSAAGLLIFTVLTGLASEVAAQDAAPAKWTILFRADDPSVWDTDAKGANGEQIAIPLKYTPATFRYLRLRRMDTREALILPLTLDQLLNDKPPARDTGFWWNGSCKEEWKGRHLGIVQGPRHRFPVPHGMIAIMNEGWDGFTGSGFGHKCFVNDGQYYCWRGTEIGRTVFEIGVSAGPLSPQEQRSLVGELVAAPTVSSSTPPMLKSETRPSTAPESETDPPGTLTRAKFEQVRNGMSEDEVTALFGPPRGSSSRTESINGGLPNTTKTLLWRETNPGVTVTVTVTIRNDKVSGKNWSRIGPARP